MKNLKKIFYSLIVTILTVHLYKAPPPPPPGGLGGTTPEAAASPIDMYVYVLAIVAVLMVVAYTRKIKKQTV